MSADRRVGVTFTPRQQGKIARLLKLGKKPEAKAYVLTVLKRRGVRMTPPPPGLTPKRWATLRDICRQMDAIWQYGAAPISSPSALRRTDVLRTVDGENRVLPASLRTTGELDGSPKEAPAMPNVTPFPRTRQERAT